MPLFASRVALDRFYLGVYIFHGTPPLLYDRSHYFVPCALPYIISCRALCPWPGNHDVTGQTFHGSTDSEKLGTDVSFTNSLNYCPQHNCIKKAFHRNTAGTIGHCDVTIAGGQLLYRRRHTRSTF